MTKILAVAFCAFAPLSAFAHGSLPEQALGAIEARSLWARYGL